MFALRGIYEPSFLFLLLFIHSFCLGSYPLLVNEQPNATLFDISSSLGDMELGVSHLQIDFGEDLYVSEVNGCLIKSPYQPVQCVPCTYIPTSENGCMQYFHKDPSFFSLPADAENCTCQECLYSEPTPITSTPRRIQLDKNALIFVPFEIPDLDKGVKLTKVVHAGSSPVVTMVNDNRFHGENVDSENSLGSSIDSTVVVCPNKINFGRNWTSTTYFVEIFAVSKGEISLKVEALDVIDNSLDSIISAPRHEVPLILPAFNIGLHTWGNSAGPLLSLVPLETCRLLSVHLEPSIGSLVTGSVINIPESKLDQLSNPFKIKTLLNLYGAPLTYSGQVLSFCPFENERSFVGVYLALVTEKFDLLLGIRDVTESPTVQSRKIGTFSPLEFSLFFKSLVILECNYKLCDSPAIPSPIFFSERTYNFERDSETCDFSSQFIVASEGDDSHLFRCFPANYVIPKSCDLLEIVPTRRSLHPLMQSIPYLVQYFGAFTSADNFLDEIPAPLHSNSISAFIQRKAHYRRDYYFMSDATMDSCQVRFSSASMVHTKKLEPLPIGPFPIKHLTSPSSSTDTNRNANMEKEEETKKGEREEPRSENCSIEAYDLVFNKILYYSHQLEHGVRPTPTEISTPPGGVLFRIGSLTTTYDYLSCLYLAESLTNFEESEITLVHTSDCPHYDLDDPCCSNTAEWESCCLTENRSLAKIENLPSSNNVRAIKNSCGNPECTNRFVDDFRKTVYGASAFECQDNLPESVSSAGVLDYCQKEWISSATKGYPCSTDSDCQNHFKLSSASCDLLKNRCVGVTQAMDYGFVNCVVENLSAVQRTFLFVYLIPDLNSYSSPIANELMIEAILAHFTQRQNISPYSPLSCNKFYSVDRSIGFSSACSVCSKRCLMESTCELPLQCYDNSLACHPVLQLAQNLCAGNEVCNWDPKRNSEKCFQEKEKCMYCFSDYSCVTIPASSKEECEEAVGCLMPNSTIIPLYNSSEECPLPPHSCETKFGELYCGYCQDPDEIYNTIHGMKKTFPMFENFSGVCLFPVVPFNTPKCPYNENPIGYSLNFSTRRGCAVLSDCQFSSSVNLSRDCLPVYPDSKSCEEGGGKWLSLPIRDQKTCESFPFLEKEVCTDGTLSQSEREYRPLPKGGCEECGMIHGDLGTWSHSRPSPVRLTGFSFVSSRMVPLFQPTLGLVYPDFEEFMSSIDDAVSSLDLLNVFYCQYRDIYAQLMLLACDCANSSSSSPSPLSDGSAFCNLSNLDFELEHSLGISTSMIFCSILKQRTVLLSYELITELTNHLDMCVPALASIAWKAEFSGNHSRVPPTLFGDPNTLDEQPVRNELGTSVGVVVENGFYFSFLVLPAEGGCSVEINLPLFGEDLEGNDPRFKYLDIGILVPPEEAWYQDELEVRPLNLANILYVPSSFEIMFQATYDCSNISEVTLYPILRMANWENVKHENLLSDGEKAMFWTFSALYALCFLFVFAVLLIVVFFKPSLSNSLVFFCGCLVFLFRSIYIGMFAAGHFYDYSGISNFMVESPSFYFLSFTTILVMGFSFTYYSFHQKSSESVPEDSEDIQKRLWVALIIVQIFLYLVMVVVLVLMVELPEEDKVTSDCFGRIVYVDHDRTVEYIRISYHSFALFVAILLALGIFLLGERIYGITKTNRILIFSAVAGGGLFITNLLWVVYSANSGSTPYFVIPLFFTEAIPILFVTFFLCPSHIKRLISSARSSAASIEREQTNTKDVSMAQL